MTLTAEQSRALVDAIVAALETLRRQMRRRWGLDLRGGFLELLIELRAVKLAELASSAESDRTA